MFILYQRASRQFIPKYVFSHHFSKYNVSHSRYFSILSPSFHDRLKKSSSRKENGIFLGLLHRSLNNNVILKKTGIHISTFQPITNRLLSLNEIKVLFRNIETERPSSQVEVTTNDLKEKIKSKRDTPAIHKPIVPDSKIKLLHYYAIIKKEFYHYMNGFKLLFIDIKLSSKYAMMILNGESLTRREYNQLIRTTGDLFRLLPFSVFIIVPAMELLLPFAIKFCPWLLPSTFETTNEREAKMKKTLKVKLETAKFLLQTLDKMSLEGKGHGSVGAQEFAAFFKKVHKTGEHVTNKEILKFSKLFEDEITLDSLSRQQLLALCRLIEISSIGSNNILRFHLRLKLRRLVADDKLIRSEGSNFLSVAELQQACKARGMRAVGLPKKHLRHQLEQWLDLSLDEKIPPSLLLLSRTLYLPEQLPTEQTLAATISSLPEKVVERTKLVLDNTEGAIDNSSLLKMIKEEEIIIEEDNKEKDLEEKKIKETAKRKEQEHIAERAAIEEPLSQYVEIPKIEKDVQEAIDAIKIPIQDPEELKDTATVMVDAAPVMSTEKEAKITAEDIDHVEEALQMIELEKKKMFIEEIELAELKSEISDYEEDIRDFKMTIKEPVVDTELKESKASKRLLKKVNKMVVKMDTLMNVLDTEKDTIANEFEKEDIVNIEELVRHLKSVVSKPDSDKLDVIRTVLNKLDADADGDVKTEHVLDVLELLSEEQESLSKKILEEVVEVVSKEDKLEMLALAREAVRLPSVRKSYAVRSPNPDEESLQKEVAAHKK